MKLEKCPFCSSESITFQEFDREVCAICLDCGAQGPKVFVHSHAVTPTEKLAKDRWNERVNKLLPELIAHYEKRIKEDDDSFNKMAKLAHDHETVMIHLANVCKWLSYFIQEDREELDDLLICHHPFIVEVPQLIYHTALDCCEGGINDIWRDHLGIKDAKHFDGNLGWFGKIDPIPFNDLVELVFSLTGGVFRTKSTSQQVESVVVCSGLGGMVLKEALQTKADCYVVGELCCKPEETLFDSVIEVGHTRSEFMIVDFFKKLLKGHSVTIESAPLKIDHFGHEK